MQSLRTHRINTLDLLRHLLAGVGGGGGGGVDWGRCSYSRKKKVTSVTVSIHGVSSSRTDLALRLELASRTRARLRRRLGRATRPTLALVVDAPRVGGAAGESERRQPLQPDHGERWWRTEPHQICHASPHAHQPLISRSPPSNHPLITL